MIKRLYLNNCFTHNDKTFTFETGLTGIIGPNESGKSLIVEMIRFALFGSKALRGKAEDYKKLHVELDFVVNNEEYTVKRKGVKVTLQSKTHNVSGTKPVDEAIRNLLGYDLHVFDVANACNQGNIEALSEMTPANRKAMVDKTVGLTALDDVITFAGQEGNALRREAETLAATLVEPVEPTKPEEFVPSAEIDLASARVQLTEFHQLEGFLSRAPRAPQDPGDAPLPETAAELKIYQGNRLALQRSLNHLEHQKGNIKPETIGGEELDDIEANLDLQDAWNQKQKLLAQGHLCCPECNHEWPVADLGELADVEEPFMQVQMSRREVTQHRALLGNNQQIEDLQQQINAVTLELEALPDRADDLSTVQAYEERVATYQRQLQAWNEYNEGLADKQARYEELQGIQETVTQLQVQLQEAQAYERDLVRYEQDHGRFMEQSIEVDAKKTKAEEFFEARELIKALKVSVKNHLLPSLNQVASILLTQMTGGERSQVVVDEDFEILIDEQRVNTLSGSGKAVANLAIRIALGQILTNKMFSVFMADEVDAAMDDDRAEYTAEALRRLTEQISQVITVTHKRPETNHTIELKK